LLPIARAVRFTSRSLPPSPLFSGDIDGVAHYNAEWSSATVLTFLYKVKKTDHAQDLAHFGVNALQLNGATIRRMSTTPTTDASLILPESNRYLRYREKGDWRTAEDTRLGGHRLYIQSVAITIRGLYHERASDLNIRLMHAGKTCTVIDAAGGVKTLGIPGERHRRTEAAREANGLNGNGFSYTFRDIEATNLALAGTATQSTTAFGGDASRAIDGNTDGRYSKGSVTHSGGHGDGDPEAWWQVKLAMDESTQINTIRMWSRVQESATPEVQAISVYAFSPMGSCGSKQGGLSGDGQLHYNESSGRCGDSYFTITVPFGAEDGGPANLTMWWSTVAMRSDEVPASTTSDEGAMPGRSLQAMLEAMPNIGQVEVTRAELPNLGADYLADAALHHNHFQWRVTFGAAGNLDQMTCPEENLGPLGSRVSVATLQDGNDNRFYNYMKEQSALKGQMSGGWLMVLPDNFTAVANTDSLEQAKSMALWKVSK
jgi:hypothetical protein